MVSLKVFNESKNLANNFVFDSFLHQTIQGISKKRTENVKRIIAHPVDFIFETLLKSFLLISEILMISTKI